MFAASVGSTLWYLARGTGLVSIVLLTMVMVFGIAQVQRFATEGWPRFVIAGLHKNLSLLVVVFFGDPHLELGYRCVRTDPVDRRGRAVRRVVSADLARIGRAELRLAVGTGDFEFGAPADWTSTVESDPLDRIWLLANRACSRVGYRQRYASGVGASAVPAVPRSSNRIDCVAPRNRMVNGPDTTFIGHWSNHFCDLGGAGMVVSWAYPDWLGSKGRYTRIGASENLGLEQRERPRKRDCGNRYIDLDRKRGQVDAAVWCGFFRIGSDRRKYDYCDGDY